jgi:hypothetical protein
MRRASLDLSASHGLAVAVLVRSSEGGCGEGPPTEGERGVMRSCIV